MNWRGFLGIDAIAAVLRNAPGWPGLTIGQSQWTESGRELAKLRTNRVAMVTRKFATYPTRVTVGPPSAATTPATMTSQCSTNQEHSIRCDERV